jgi:sirohydrochlorin ferrochelatase
MPADNAKQPLQGQYEAIGAELLSEHTRADVHAKIQQLRDKMAEVNGASARATDPDRAAMNLYLRNSQSAWLKAEELHTVADGMNHPEARQSVRKLAEGYERMAEQAEAREAAAAKQQK